MLRKAALLLLPIALLGAACGSDSDKAGTKASMTKANATATVARAATKAPPASEPDGTPDAQSSAGSDDVVSTLFDTVNPFSMLDGLNAAPSAADVDPSLRRELLDEDDVPTGFEPMGVMTYDLPTEHGTAQMAASMFASGDPNNLTGTMVMSASVALPTGALAEFNSLGGIEELQNITEADLQELQSSVGEIGLGFSDLRLLDAAGLGDGGVGMHMAMDFSGLLEAFGAPPEDNPFAGGIAIDMYIFLRGDHMLMTMVMWPADQPSGVDSRDLAEAMDAAAGGNSS